jgi:hypothetical protein
MSHLFETSSRIKSFLLKILIAALIALTLIIFKVYIEKQAPLKIEDLNKIVEEEMFENHKEELQKLFD